MKSFANTALMEPLPKDGPVQRAVKNFGDRAFPLGLFEFARDVLGYRDLEPNLHGELCRLLEEPYERKLVLLPRGHFKTSLCTISYPIWRILRDPDVRIALVGTTQSNAEAYLREIRGHLETNSIIQAGYPHLSPSAPGAGRWTTSELTVERSRLHKESSIEAVGVGVTVVGRHYDLIIYDDIVTVETASTAHQRTKLSQWYRYSLSLLEPGGEALVVGTRYHHRDLYGELLESNRYRVLLRKALEEGRPILPGRFSLESLNRLRNEQGSYIFSCQYLNEPVDEEHAPFRRSHLRYIPRQELPREMLYFITVDPAMGNGAGSDYTAIVTCGMDREGNLYVVDMVRARPSPSDLIDELFWLHERWRPARMGIEAVGFQATLVHFLQREMLERGTRLPLVPIKRTGGETKSLRILALQPIFERGKLLIVEGCPHASDLEEELLRFPRGATDDLLDALADQLQIAFPPSDSDGIHRLTRQDRPTRTGY